MYALQIADGTQIPYSAAVIMEIYEDDAKKFYVKVCFLKILNCIIFLKNFSFYTGTMENCIKRNYQSVN